MEIYELIRDMPLFAQMSEEEVRQVSGIKQVALSYAPGEAIIEEGENTRSLFLLLQGTTLITKRINEAVIRLAKLNPGDLFGEMSFFSEKPRRTNVTAHDRVRVLKMDNDFFAQVSPAIRDRIKDHIIGLLIERLDYMNDQIMKISQALRI